MTFWLTVLLLCILIGPAVLWPLWSRRADRPLGDGLEADDTAALWQEEKDRLVAQIQALDVSLAEAKISTEEHARERAALSAEAERALAQLRKVRRATTTADSGHRPRTYPIVGGVLAGLLLLAGGGITIYVGGDVVRRDVSPHGQESLPLAAGEPASGQEAPDIGAMVARLEGRVAEGDASADDLLMLARSYRTLGRSDDSISLYQRALEADPDNLEALVSLGVALYGSQNEDKREDAESFFDRALAHQPDLPEALWYKSLLLLRRHEVTEARSMLEHLDALAEGIPEVRLAVRKALAQIAASEPIPAQEMPDDPTSAGGSDEPEQDGPPTDQ
jgi:cytochrome c-type biogenesis protein CcmH/NrfG